MRDLLLFYVLMTVVLVYKVGAGQSGHVILEKDHDGPLEETGS